MRALVLLNDPKAGTWIAQRLRWQLLEVITTRTLRYLVSMVLSGLLAINVNAQSRKPSETPKSHASVCSYNALYIPETKLLHFDSPGRIANQYLVSFKCDEALAKDGVNPTSLKSQVLSGTLPTSQENCTALASAYVARFGGHLDSVWCRFKLRAFSITDISESAIANLAKDPRVEFVESNMRTIDISPPH